MTDPVYLWLTLAVALAGVLLLIWLYHSSLNWHAASKFQARLPEGSFGWPIIGETLEFGLSPYDFSVSHYNRYGSIFKSSLFLKPAILGTTPEFTRFVCNNTHLFKVQTPRNIKILGPKAFIVKDGPAHMSVKKVLQKPLLPDGLRSRVQMLETIVLQNLAKWVDSGTVLGRDVMRTITLEAAAYLLFGVPDMASTPEGKSCMENLKIVAKSLLSFPVNLPGTKLNKACKAKEGLESYVKHLLKERSGREHTQSDMLGGLLAAIDDPESPEDVKVLDEGAVLDNILAMWVGLFETTSTTLMWIAMFLEQYPEITRRVEAEQEEILQGKPGYSVDGPRLTWEDTKTMVYTQKFFKEQQRIVSIVPIVPRQAAEDVVFNGYLIPKGWAVFPIVNFVHMDPNIFPEPKVFNPDRFDETPKPYSYQPFSSGPHMCPGADTGRLISYIVIHHLTTTFITKRAGPDRGTEHRPFPSPIGGYPMTISRRH